MPREVALRQSMFVDLDSVGFDVAYIKNRDTVPVVGLGMVDFGTDEERTAELRVGQPFQVAGQTWQISEIRNPTEPDWEVILRRMDDQ